MRHCVNSPHVISETLDGETIIVNLSSGHYFNLQGTAVEVWDAVERGADTAEVVADLERRYAASDGEIASAVEKFLAELTAAELIVPDGDGPAPARGDETFAAERAPFAPPTLTVHTDMQDIILLDPVHEVDPRGWPHAQAGV